LFPGITDNAKARAHARTIAGWQPLPVPGVPGDAVASPMIAQWKLQPPLLTNPGLGSSSLVRRPVSGPFRETEVRPLAKQAATAYEVDTQAVGEGERSG
jgi:hypothetical protein